MDSLTTSGELLLYPFWMRASWCRQNEQQQDTDCNVDLKINNCILIIPNTNLCITHVFMMKLLSLEQILAHKAILSFFLEKLTSLFFLLCVQKKIKTERERKEKKHECPPLHFVKWWYAHLTKCSRGKPIHAHLCLSSTPSHHHTHTYLFLARNNSTHKIWMQGISLFRI